MQTQFGYKDPSSARNYAAANGLQFKQAWEFLSSACPVMHGRLLDFGCGTGGLTAEISRHYSVEATGVDVSPDRVRYAMQNHARGGAQFVCGDITEGVLSENRYDTLVSFNAVHHVLQKDMKKTFGAFFNLMSDDGIAYLLIPSRSPVLQDAISEVVSSEKWSSIFSGFEMSMARTYQPAQYYRLVSNKAGFVLCRAIMVKQEGPLQTFSEFKKMVEGFLPYLVVLKDRVESSIYEQSKDELLTGIAECYFGKRGVTKTARVKVSVVQNQLTLFKSHLAVLTYVEQMKKYQYQYRSRL